MELTQGGGPTWDPVEVRLDRAWSEHMHGGQQTNQGLYRGWYRNGAGSGIERLWGYVMGASQAWGHPCRWEGKYSHRAAPSPLQLIWT